MFVVVCFDVFALCPCCTDAVTATQLAQKLKTGEKIEAKVNLVCGDAVIAMAITKMIVHLLN